MGPVLGPHPACDGVQEDEQAKAEEELDPVVQERRRLEQAEKWRLQQLKAGASSEENANFQVYNMLLMLSSPLSCKCVDLQSYSAHTRPGMSCRVKSLRPTRHFGAAVSGIYFGWKPEALPQAVFDTDSRLLDMLALPSFLNSVPVCNKCAVACSPCQWIGGRS